MSEEQKIYGVIEFTKKGSPKMATFIMDEEMLVEGHKNLDGIIGATLLHMDWKRENTPLEIKCFGLAHAWEKRLEFHELDALSERAKEELKEELEKEKAEEEENELPVEPYKPV